MKQVSITMFACMIAGICVAQKNTRLLTGLITCEPEGRPLEGAVVWAKGTKMYSGAQPDGIYFIPVTEKDSVLVFAYDGFQTEEIRITQEREYNVQLRRSAAQRPPISRNQKLKIKN